MVFLYGYSYTLVPIGTSLYYCCAISHMASDFTGGQCSSATYERVAATTSLSSPHSANSSSTCSQAGSGTQGLERVEVCPKEKFDLLEWLRFVFLDDVDEVSVNQSNAVLCSYQLMVARKRSRGMCVCSRGRGSSPLGC